MSLLPFAKSVVTVWGFFSLTVFYFIDLDDLELGVLEQLGARLKYSTFARFQSVHGFGATEHGGLSRLFLFFFFRIGFFTQHLS